MTGEDIDLEDCFECDLKGVILKEGVSLFSPRKEVSRFLKSTKTESYWKLHSSTTHTALSSRFHTPNLSIVRPSGSEDIAIPTS